MSNQVYANSMEISCKAAAGKSICAFPDVCMTPPLTPATPAGVPIPYPNTGMAGDATQGSTSVTISGQEIMLKNKSFFKKSTGDEAGSAPKKGVMTSVITGKVYFNAWSMDVKVEGENVVRHMDLMTHNHASYPCNTPTWPYLDKASLKKGGACAGVDPKYAMEPYSKGCDNKKTPHHVIPNRQAFSKGVPRFPEYTRGSAPCLCVTGSNQHAKVHGRYHAVVDGLEYKAVRQNAPFTYTSAKENALKSVVVVNDLSGKQAKKVAKCVAKQLDNYFKKRCGAKPGSTMRKSDKRGKNLSGNWHKMAKRAR
jgi:hypothetical protein